MLKLKRYELHQTQDGADMRQRDDGEWCDADDVEKLEARLAEALRLLNEVIHPEGLVSQAITQELYDECVIFFESKE